MHCDVSPSNLFISRLGEIKLGDFGIAKVRSMGGDDGGATLWGKLAYLAPEQLERKPLTPQVDLWGAATILYECLTNQRAIQGSDNDQMQEALRAGRISGVESLRPDVPTGLGDVVHRALQIDPAVRYGSAPEFALALQPYHDEISGGALGIASVVRGLFKVLDLDGAAVDERRRVSPLLERANHRSVHVRQAPQDAAGVDCALLGDDAAHGHRAFDLVFQRLHCVDGIWPFEHARRSHAVVER